MKKIAITGGIGSGKSTVLNILREKGYIVFSCDEIYKKIIVSKRYIKEIEKYFPQSIKDGKIDREILSEIIFHSAEKRDLLNSIAHPFIIEQLFQEIKTVDSNLVFVEVPLLFESNLESEFDEVIVVMREKDERIKAVCERDATTKESVLKRMDSQFDYQSLNGKERIQKSNARVLINNDTIERLVEKIDTILCTV